MSSPTTDLQLPEGMTALEILKAARDLISVPERWTQGSVARNTEGRPTATCAIDAVCWCSHGAILRVSGRNDGQSFTAAQDFLDAVTGVYITFNDSHTHAEVLAAFDRAIEATGGSNGQ